MSFTDRAFVSAVDQAAGLRRMFAAQRRIVALASGPTLASSGVAVERMASAMAVHARQLLVVDAGDASPALPESAVWGLGSALERLSPTMAYLPARGLPRRCIDVHGSSACLIDELTRVMPQADALLIHAGPMDLVRMLKGHVLRPVIACGGDLDAVKEAYATVKLLAQRLGWVTFDLLVLSGRGDVPAHRIADALAQCAERHAGCTLRTWTVIDPQVDPRREPDAALQALAVSHLCEPKVDGVFAVASETPQPAGTPRRRTSSASLASTRSH